MLLVALATPASQEQAAAKSPGAFRLPLPASVSVKSYRMGRGMTDGTYIFVFSINPSELESIPEQLGLHLLNPDSDRQSLPFSKSGSQHGTAAANIEWPLQAIYQSETNRGVCKSQNNPCPLEPDDVCSRGTFH